VKQIVLSLLLIVFLSGCGADWFPANKTTSASLTITTTTLPAATALTADSQALAATGGSSPYTWTAVTTGTLPPGLSLSPAGVISGTPTAGGNFSFTVQVSDSSTPALTASQKFSIQVSLPAALAAGQSITMGSGESVKVPPGTTVAFNSSTAIVNGNNDTVNTSAGAVVTVPSTATGTADNTVIAQ